MYCVKSKRMSCLSISKIVLKNFPNNSDAAGQLRSNETWKVHYTVLRRTTYLGFAKSSGKLETAAHGGKSKPRFSPVIQNWESQTKPQESEDFSAFQYRLIPRFFQNFFLGRTTKKFNCIGYFVRIRKNRNLSSFFIGKSQLARIADWVISQHSPSFKILK
jgi:hypothetical protein